MRFVFGPSALLLSSFARTHSQPLFLSLSSCLHPFYLNWMCSFPLPPLPAPPSSSLSLLFCCGSTDSTVQAVYKLISFRRYLCNCSSCCEFSVFFLFVHSLNCSTPFCRGPLYILVRRVVAKIVLQNSILQSFTQCTLSIFYRMYTLYIDARCAPLILIWSNFTMQFYTQSPTNIHVNAIFIFHWFLFSAAFIIDTERNLWNNANRNCFINFFICKK